MKSSYLYLGLLICLSALCIFLHMENLKWEKKLLAQEVSKFQMTTHFFDSLQDKEKQTLTPAEVDQLITIFTIYHLGDLEQAYFKIEHLDDPAYLSAKAAQYLKRAKENGSPLPEKISYQKKTFDLWDQITQCLHQNDHLILKK